MLKNGSMTISGSGKRKESKKQKEAPPCVPLIEGESVRIVILSET